MAVAEPRRFESPAFDQGLRLATSLIQALRSPWEATFKDIATAAANDLLILSPYITRRPLDDLVSILRHAGRDHRLTVKVVTDLSPGALASEALDARALLSLLERLPAASLTHLPRLHAKVYIADHACAVVTSANLTDGGLSLNREYGLRIDDSAVVTTIREDAEEYARLGGEVSREALADLLPTADELVALRRRIEREASRDLKVALRSRASLASAKLMRVRARGKTTHGILADTLLYLLRRGPQATVDLHKQIQQIHPDVCDDAIDRVIDGVHFGKKWKHYVRTTQQHLKKKGMIFYEEGRWYRAERGHYVE